MPKETTFGPSKDELPKAKEMNEEKVLEATFADLNNIVPVQDPVDEEWRKK